MSVLVFDIETVPDVASGHRLYGLEGRGDADVAKAMFHLRGQETGNEVLRPHLQRVVATFAVSRSGDTFKVWSLGDIDAIGFTRRAENLDDTGIHDLFLTHVTVAE